MKLESGWVGAGGNKLSRTQVIVNSDWAQAMMAHVWSGIIFEREPYRLGIAPPSRSLDLRVHLSHRGHGLNAQRRRGGHDVMSFPDMDHEPGNDVPDVMPLFHMGTAVEDVRAPQLFGHLGNQSEQEPGHDGLVFEISELRMTRPALDAKTVHAEADDCLCRLAADDS